MNLPAQCLFVTILPLEVMKLVKGANGIQIVSDNARRLSFTKENLRVKVPQGTSSDPLTLKKTIVSQSRVITRHSSNDIGYDRWTTRSQSREGDRAPASRTPPRRSISADYAPSMPKRRPCEESPKHPVRFCSVQPVPKRKESVRMIV